MALLGLYEFGRGVVHRRGCVLDGPDGSVSGGENVEFGRGVVRTRGAFGYVTSGTVGAGAGAVRGLWQVQFSRTDENPLVAQYTVSGTERLGRSAAGHPPVSSGGLAWSEMISLGAGAGICSVGGLNDRVVFTEGSGSAPVIWGGGVSADGADWPAPTAVFVTRDGGVTYTDITGAVIDRDAGTSALAPGLSAASGWVMVCCDMPTVSGFRFDVASGNTSGGTLGVSVWSGSWGSGVAWTDGTSGLAMTGTVTGAGVVSGVHARFADCEGYWYRFVPSAGTSAATALGGVRFVGPAQAMGVTGDGGASGCAVFCHYDNSLVAWRGWENEVGDGSMNTVARLNDGDLSAPAAFATNDVLFVGYGSRFSGVEIRPHNDYPNKAAGTLSGQYWNGVTWAGMSITDGTKGPSGRPLSVRGAVSWAVPADWAPVNMSACSGKSLYYAAFKTSLAFTDRTYVSEARVYPIADAVRKYGHVANVRDRLIFGGRSDDEAAVDVTRGGAPTGLAGDDWASLRCAPGQQIVAMASAFNQVFISTPDDWYILNGYNGRTFALERAETGGLGPVNGRVLVRAAHSERGSTNVMGLYYLNAGGAYHFAGLRVNRISDDAPWWDWGWSGLQIDRENVGTACGVFLSDRDRVVWAAPMRASGGAGAQTTNNYLLSYDVTRGVWGTPIPLAAASLAAVRNLRTTSPGGLGELELYFGDYSGRIGRQVVGEYQSDYAASGGIPAWFSSQWMSPGGVGEKHVRSVGLHSRNSGVPVLVSVYRNGEGAAAWSGVFYAGTSGNGVSTYEARPVGVSCRYFRIEARWSGYAEIHGLEVDWGGHRGAGGEGSAT